MIDSVATQKAKVSSLLAAKDYPAMYRYIAGQFGGGADPSAPKRRAERRWLLSAAKINETNPESPSLLKFLIWKSNDAASVAAVAGNRG